MKAELIAELLDALSGAARKVQLEQELHETRKWAARTFRGKGEDRMDVCVQLLMDLSKVLRDHAQRHHLSVAETVVVMGALELSTALTGRTFLEDQGFWAKPAEEESIETRASYAGEGGNA